MLVRICKYMEIGLHRGMIANEHVRIASNSYEKVKSGKYFGSLVTFKILFRMK